MCCICLFEVLKLNLRFSKTSAATGCVMLTFREEELGFNDGTTCVLLLFSIVDLHGLWKIFLRTVGFPYFRLSTITLSSGKETFLLLFQMFVDLVIVLKSKSSISNKSMSLTEVFFCVSVSFPSTLKILTNAPAAADLCGIDLDTLTLGRRACFDQQEASC